MAGWGEEVEESITEQTQTTAVDVKVNSRKSELSPQRDVCDRFFSARDFSRTGRLRLPIPNEQH